MPVNVHYWSAAAEVAKKFEYSKLISSSGDSIDRLFEVLEASSLKGYWLFVAGFIRQDRLVGVGVGVGVNI